MITTATTTSAPPVPPRQRVGRIVANALLFAFLLWTLQTILTTPEMQGDMWLRYHAAKVWRDGGNPYDPAALSRAAGEEFDTAYIYPPDTLPFYAVFSWFGAGGVRFAYLGFQMALLAALLVCWQRFFLEPSDRFHPLFFVLCLTGLGNSLLTDLRVGNVGVGVRRATASGQVGLRRRHRRVGGQRVAVCLLGVAVAAEQVAGDAQVVPDQRRGATPQRDRRQQGIRGRRIGRHDDAGQAERRADRVRLACQDLPEPRAGRCRLSHGRLGLRLQQQRIAVAGMARELAGGDGGGNAGLAGLQSDLADMQAGGIGGQLLRAWSATGQQEEDG